MLRLILCGLSELTSFSEYANGFSDSTGDHQVSVHDRCMRGHTSESGVDSRQIDAPKMLKGCDDCSLGFSPGQPTTAEQNGSDHYVLSQDNNICKPQVSQSVSLKPSNLQTCLLYYKATQIVVLRVLPSLVPTT